jgi:hypothetical protein
MSILRVLALLSVLVFVGCGSDITSTPIQPAGPTPAAQSAKATLEEIAKTGELGSGMESLKQSLEQVKQADAAKGDALLADLKTLESTTDAEQIKAKAKEMAGKL